MDDSRFWLLIDAAKAQAGAHPQARPPALRAALAGLATTDIQSFQRTYDRMRQRANRWDLRSAAELILGRRSDTGFHAFLDWLISEGRDGYERALADPDSLADVPVHGDCELDAFGDAALDAYAEHTDKPLERDRPDDGVQPERHAWHEAELSARLPRLIARYAR